MLDIGAIDLKVLMHGERRKIGKNLFQWRSFQNLYLTSLQNLY